MDAELAAMQSLAEVLGGLDKPAQERVLGWAISRFALSCSTSASPKGLQANSGIERSTSFTEFAELFHAMNPSDNGAKALAAAYWLSRGDGEAFTAQAANGLLKDMGYHVPNITDALTQCMKEKPATIIQTRKSGSSRQARKLYKLTDAGRRKVSSLIEQQKLQE
jgi:hypothetical protein